MADDTKDDIKADGDPPDGCSFCNDEYADTSMIQYEQGICYECTKCKELDPRMKYNYYFACKLLKLIDNKKVDEFKLTLSAAAIKKLNFYGGKAENTNDGFFNFHTIFNKWIDNKTSKTLLAKCIGTQNESLIKFVLTSTVSHIPFFFSFSCLFCVFYVF